MTVCKCQTPHTPRRIVLTGGPGAGKTAVLELVHQYFCQHIYVLAESASILFRGGFPRGKAPSSLKAAQRAIFHVQRELEAAAVGESQPAIFLCDRGTVDGYAYWPGPEDFWGAVGTTRAAELVRYDMVIHMRTPSLSGGYNHDNPLRIESPHEATLIDERIVQAWEGHPRRIFIESTPNFLHKANSVIDVLRAEVPLCCRA